MPEDTQITLTKKERKALKREKKQQQRSRDQRRKAIRGNIVRTAWIVVALLAVFGLYKLFVLPSSDQPSTTTPSSPAAPNSTNNN